MNTRRFLSPMSMTIILTIFTLLIAVGIALAQPPVTGTEPGAVLTTPKSTASSDQADGGVLPQRQAPLLRATTDGGAAEPPKSQ